MGVFVNSILLAAVHLRLLEQVVFINFLGRSVFACVACGVTQQEPFHFPTVHAPDVDTLQQVVPKFLVALSGQKVFLDGFDLMVGGHLVCVSLRFVVGRVIFGAIDSLVKLECVFYVRRPSGFYLYLFDSFYTLWHHKHGVVALLLFLCLLLIFEGVFYLHCSPQRTVFRLFRLLFFERICIQLTFEQLLEV